MHFVGLERSEGFQTRRRPDPPQVVGPVGQRLAEPLHFERASAAPFPVPRVAFGTPREGPAVSLESLAVPRCAPASAGRSDPHTSRLAVRQGRGARSVRQPLASCLIPGKDCKSPATPRAVQDRAPHWVHRLLGRMVVFSPRPVYTRGPHLQTRHQFERLWPLSAFVVRFPCAVTGRTRPYGHGRTGSMCRTHDEMRVGIPNAL